MYEVLRSLNATTDVRANKMKRAVNKVRHEFRQIFFEMGFEEMPTNRCYLDNLL